jgi:hypothetical protein
MRGDQSAWTWRIIRAIKVSANGLAVTEIAQRQETGIRTINLALEAFQAAGVSPHAQRVQRANRRAFIDNLKFKFLPSFSLTKLASLVFTAFPTEGLKSTPSYDSLDSMRALRK